MIPKHGSSHGALRTRIQLSPSSVPPLAKSRRTLPITTADRHAEAPHCHVLSPACAARPPMPAITYMASFFSSFSYFPIFLSCIFLAVYTPLVHALVFTASFSCTMCITFSTLFSARCTAAPRAGTSCHTLKHHSTLHLGGWHAPPLFTIALYYYYYYLWFLSAARLCPVAAPPFCLL